MAKRLSEIYRPKAKGEKDFVSANVKDEHKVKDPAGNGDDVFTASNVKPASRKAVKSAPVNSDVDGGMCEEWVVVDMHHNKIVSKHGDKQADAIRSAQSLDGEHWHKTKGRNRYKHMATHGAMGMKADDVVKHVPKERPEKKPKEPAKPKQTTGQKIMHHIGKRILHSLFKEEAESTANYHIHVLLSKGSSGSKSFKRHCIHTTLPRYSGAPNEPISPSFVDGVVHADPVIKHLKGNGHFIEHQIGSHEEKAGEQIMDEVHANKIRVNDIIRRRFPKE